MSGTAHLIAAFATSVDSSEGIAYWMPWTSPDNYSIGWRADWLEDAKRHWYFYTRVRADSATMACYSGPTGDYLVDHQVSAWSMDIGGDGD